MKQETYIIGGIIAVIIIFFICYNNKTFLINWIAKNNNLDKEQLQLLTVKELQKLL